MPASSHTQQPLPAQVSTEQEHQRRSLGSRYGARTGSKGGRGARRARGEVGLEAGEARGGRDGAGEGGEREDDGTGREHGGRLMKVG